MARGEVRYRLQLDASGFQKGGKAAEQAITGLNAKVGNFAVVLDKSQKGTNKFGEAVGKTSQTLARLGAAAGVPVGPLRALAAAEDLASGGMKGLASSAIGFNAATVGGVAAAGALGFAVGTLIRKIPGVAVAVDGWTASLHRLFTAQEELDRQALGKMSQAEFQAMIAAGHEEARRKQISGMNAEQAKAFLLGKERLSIEQQLVKELEKQEKAAAKWAAEQEKAVNTVMSAWRTYQGLLQEIEGDFRAMLGTGPMAMFGLGKLPGEGSLAGQDNMLPSHIRRHQMNVAEGQQALLNAGASLERQNKATWGAAGEGAGGGFLEGFEAAVKDLPAVILAAIQGGGDVGKALGASVGGSIGQSMADSLTKPDGALTKMFGETIGGAIGSTIPIVGTLLGGALGGFIGGLFGGGAAERARREALEKLKKDTLSAFDDLKRKIDAVVMEKLHGGIGGLAALFKHAAAGVELTQERMDRLGLLGGVMFEELRRQGMSTVEAFRAMGPALEQALAAIEKFGLSMSGTFAALLDFQKKVAANEDLVNAAEGLASVWTALAATGNLTADTAKAMLGEVKTIYDELIAKGFTSQQALALIAPVLKQIRDWAAEGKIELDAFTKGLIDAAETGGLFEGLTDPMEELVELQKLMLLTLGALVQVFGVELPDAVKKYIAELNNIPGIPGAPTPPIPGPPGPPDKGFAHGGISTGPESGHYELLHGREAVIPLGGGGFDLGAVEAQLRLIADQNAKLPRILSKSVRDAILVGRA